MHHSFSDSSDSEAPDDLDTRYVLPVYWMKDSRI